LVAEAPDGTIAAFCIVWLDAENAHGVIEPVGCRSAHRRRGLSKSVVFEGMRRIRDLGALTASVLSHPSEVSANRLYTSAGFVDAGVDVEWTKPLI
ncbi:MAG: GNAT family N-acetyltransferase, partial [Thermomicrobiales bacterium]